MPPDDTATSSSRPVVADLDRVHRWVDFGGTCRVVQQDADRAIIALCRCDGPEVERFTSADPAAVQYALGASS
ncbi:hypothetical protein [Luteipulveratus halotolerans]|uniref:Uncharacterized protein n=1 Tax=Luteipulveratus halotolerans TaxID=1631356 RepID=A0A0L6CIR3_9MICO|nr:hypothetical protein [Luteipulveratus halotolerans]KNX37485.1 hypothetical protein VV01_10540 [Luteipulveratus halotolerans]